MKLSSFFKSLFGKIDDDFLWRLKAWRLFLLLFVLLFPFIFSFLQNSTLSVLFVVSFLFLGIAFFSPRSVFILMVTSVSFEIINFLPQEWSFSLRPYQFFVGIIFLGLLIRGTITLLKRKHLYFFPLNLIDIGVLCIIFGGFVSAFFSEFFKESFRLNSISVSFVLLYVLVRWFLRSNKDIISIIPYVIASFVSTVFYAILQNILFLSHRDWHKEVMPGRPNAFFSEPDWLGFYLAILLFLLWFFFFSVEKKKRYKGDKIGILLPLWIASTFGFMAFIITVSRSAWLGLFCGLSFLILWSVWKQKTQSIGKIFFLLLSFFIALFYVLVFPLTNFELGNRAQSSISGLQEITISCASKIELPSKISSDQELLAYNCQHIDLFEIEKESVSGKYVTRVFRKDPNAEIRKDIWQKTQEIIRNNFFFGIGWGGTASVFGEDSRGEHFNASNIFFGMWLGAGIGGFLGLLLIGVYVTFFSLQALFSKERETSKIGIGILGSFIVVAIFNMFNSSEFLAIMWIWLGIIGFLFSEMRNKKSNK